MGSSGHIGLGRIAVAVAGALVALLVAAAGLANSVSNTAPRLLSARGASYLVLYVALGVLAAKAASAVGGSLAHWSGRGGVLGVAGLGLFTAFELKQDFFGLALLAVIAPAMWLAVELADYRRRKSDARAAGAKGSGDTAALRQPPN